MKNVKNWSEFMRINELNKETYASIMNRTENWPTTRYSGNKDDATIKKADQMGRVNTMARERFHEEFMNEFKDSEIVNGSTIYKFVTIRFKSNWTNYTLVFENPDDQWDTLEIKHTSRAPGYELDNGVEDELNARSIELINSMFRFIGGL